MSKTNPDFRVHLAQELKKKYPQIIDTAEELASTIDRIQIEYAERLSKNIASLSRDDVAWHLANLPPGTMQ